MIHSFVCKDTEKFWQEGKTIRWKNIERQAMKKLAMLAAVQKLEDLRVPPGNRLEALKGNRAGQHSIRINNQWRLCFRWDESGPGDVEITDYH
jgi:proteic killer suppression protein